MISPIYSVGECVYIKYQAQQGVLERVCIKKINQVVIEPFNYLTQNFQDSFNRLWLENELITEEEAEAIIADLT